MPSGMGTSKAAARRFAAQINADLPFGTAHYADQFTLGALGIASNAPAYRDFLLLLLLQVADLFSKIW